MIREGGDDTHVLILLRGFAKVTMMSTEGQSLVAVRGPGDVVGELAATSGERRLASVTACSPVLAQVVVGDVFRRFLAQHPDAWAEVTAVVAKRLGASNRRRVEFVTKPMQSRLLGLLVELAAFCGETPDGTVHIPLKQGELAAMIGASEDSVQRALRTLRADGLVGTAYRSTILRDLPRLRAMAESAAA